MNRQVRSVRKSQVGGPGLAVPRDVDQEHRLPFAHERAHRRWGRRRRRSGRLRREEAPLPATCRPQGQEDRYQAAPAAPAAAVASALTASFPSHRYPPVSTVGVPQRCDGAFARNLAGGAPEPSLKGSPEHRIRQHAQRPRSSRPATQSADAGTQGIELGTGEQRSQCHDRRPRDRAGRSDQGDAAGGALGHPVPRGSGARGRPWLSPPSEVAQVSAAAAASELMTIQTPSPGSSKPAEPTDRRHAAIGDYLPRVPPVPFGVHPGGLPALCQPGNHAARQEEGAPGRRPRASPVPDRTAHPTSSCGHGAPAGKGAREAGGNGDASGKERGKQGGHDGKMGREWTGVNWTDGGRRDSRAPPPLRPPPIFCPSHVHPCRPFIPSFRWRSSKPCGTSIPPSMTGSPSWTPSW